MQTPHDNWAKYYEYVYGATFPVMYRELTPTMVDIIKTILPSGTIIDYGAGTGRLSVPLSRAGYGVIAVERSSGMVSELRRHAAGQDIAVHHCGIADYSNGVADLALAVFTVLSYCTTESALYNALENIAKHLRPGACFLFDLPGRYFFEAGVLVNISAPNLTRHVQVIRTESPEVFRYMETCKGMMDGEAFAYEDAFLIRQWQPQALDQMLRTLGMEDTGRQFGMLASTGSQYYLYRKVGY